MLGERREEEDGSAAPGSPQRRTQQDARFVDCVCYILANAYNDFKTNFQIKY